VPVYFNSGVLEVRANVRQCLSDLEKLGKFRYVWIDSICINQEDLQERNSQVRMMGEIYSNAAAVILWLGVYQEAIARAFQVIESWCYEKEVRYRPHTTWELAMGPSEVGSWSPRTEDFVEEYADGLFKEVEVGVACEALRPLVSLEYWERMWIIQEVLLAQFLKLMCGNRLVAGRKVKLAFDFLCQDWSRRDDLTKGLRGSSAWSLFCDRENLSTMPGEEKITFMTLLHRFKYSKCSDKRDKLFALLSINNAGKRCGLQANYSWTQEELLMVALGCAFYKRSGYEAGYRALNDAEFLQSALDICACEPTFVQQMLDPQGGVDAPDGTVRLTHRDGSTSNIPIFREFLDSLSCIKTISSHDLHMTNYDRILHELEHCAAAKSSTSARAHLQELLNNRSTFERFVIDDPWFSCASANRSGITYAELPPNQPRIFLDEDGAFGVVCPGAQAGDMIYTSLPMFSLLPVRIVVRRLEGSELYLVGRAYYTTQTRSHRLVPLPERPEELQVKPVETTQMCVLHPLSILALSSPMPGYPRYEG
jgi:hypothetical protein